MVAGPRAVSVDMIEGETAKPWWWKNKWRTLPKVERRWDLWVRLRLSLQGNNQIRSITSMDGKVGKVVR
jgi:hypothetical protein